MEGQPQARQDVSELRARIETGVEAALEIPESKVITAVNRIWPVRSPPRSCCCSLLSGYVDAYPWAARFC